MTGPPGWPDKFELHHSAALLLLFLAAMHAWVYPRVSERLTYQTLQVMAVVLFVGAVVLWFLPS